MPRWRADSEAGVRGHRNTLLKRDLAVGEVGSGKRDRQAAGDALTRGLGDLGEPVGAARADRDAAGLLHDRPVERDLELPGVHDPAKRVRDDLAGGVGVHHVDVVLHEHAAPLRVEAGVVDDGDLAEREAQAQAHAGVAPHGLGRARMDRANSQR